MPYPFSRQAPVAQWIERSPAEAEAVGSSPTRRARAISSVGQSTCFTRKGSEVQVLYRPPGNAADASRHHAPRGFWFCTYGK